MSPTELLPVVRVTLNFLLLFTVFISFQAFSKFYLFAKLKQQEAAGKKDGSSESQKGIGSTAGLSYKAQRNRRRGLRNGACFMWPCTERLSFYGVKYGKQGGKIALLGDRVVGNTLEQGLLFLPLLWMHAIFVSPVTATTYGWVLTTTDQDRAT